MVRSSLTSESWATLGIDLHLELDPAAGRRSGLETALRAAVRDGRLAPRTRLPSTRALAAELGLSRGTVSAAYDQLIAEGYLTARHGSGTAVAVLDLPRDGGAATRSAALEYRHDLRPGSPDLTTFPATAYARAVRRVLAAAPAEVYGYGDPRGRWELRSALADYLGRVRGVRATPERIVITSGFVQGLGLLARVIAERGGGGLAMEDPGLPLHRDVVRAAGAGALALPVDEHGARTDMLGSGGLSRAAAAVVTAAHQYPIGVTLRPGRRHAAVDWAKAAGGLVVEDDYDGEFRYDRQPIGALQGMAPDHVAYLGTTSKTLGPALRLAWLVLPSDLVEPVADAKRLADYQSESIGQLALADLITSHVYDRHVRACRLRYRRRRDALVRCLRPLAESSPGLAVEGIAAGLHALIRLPGGLSEAALLDRAAQRRLAIEGLAGHWHRPGDHPQGLVVGYGTPPGHGFEAALAALAATFA